MELTVNATGHGRAIIKLSDQLGTENCDRCLKKNMWTLWVTQQHGRNPVRGTRRKVSVPVSSVRICAEEAEERGEYIHLDQSVALGKGGSGKLRLRRKGSGCEIKKYSRLERVAQSGL